MDFRCGFRPQKRLYSESMPPIHNPPSAVTISPPRPPKALFKASQSPVLPHPFVTSNHSSLIISSRSLTISKFCSTPKWGKAWMILNQVNKFNQKVHDRAEQAQSTHQELDVHAGSPRELRKITAAHPGLEVRSSLGLSLGHIEGRRVWVGEAGIEMMMKTRRNSWLGSEGVEGGDRKNHERHCLFSLFVWNIFRRLTHRKLSRMTLQLSPPSLSGIE